jgi:hypothetical protein
MITDQRGLPECGTPDDAEGIHAAPRPQTRSEALRCARPAGAERSMVVSLQTLAPLVDDFDEGLTEDGVHIRVEGFDAFLEEGRLELIIMRRPFEILTGWQLECSIEVGRRSDIVWLTVVADS